MKAEFKGCIVSIDGFQGAFSITVGNETATFNPIKPSMAELENAKQEATSAPTEDKESVRDNCYRLSFNPLHVWAKDGVRDNKINTMKAFREFTGCSLVEAKNVVEGNWAAWLNGGEFEGSFLSQALTKNADGVWNVLHAGFYHEMGAYTFFFT